MGKTVISGSSDATRTRVPVSFSSGGKVTCMRRKRVASATLENSTKMSEEDVPEKVARLKYSSDYSFLFPDEEKAATVTSVKSSEAHSRQIGGENVSSQEKGSAAKAEGLDENTSTAERKRLIIRWRITAAGKAKIIKDSDSDNAKLPCASSKVRDDEAERRRISFITEVFQTILKDKNMKGKSIFKRKDKKQVSQMKSEEERSFKICKPRWKRICPPKVSLGAPRLLCQR